MTVSLGGEPFELRERTAELSVLAELLTAVARERSGRIALVYGEAGIGKTSIVRAFCESAAATVDVLWGRCDDLSTPRPLGPFVEIAEMAGLPLAQLLRSASTPYEVATALTRQLGAGSPTVVVLEDVHLADEATLDVLRLFGSRLAELPVLILATYRNDAVGRWHPLRIALGELAAGTHVDRIRLARLSPETVSVMASEHDVRGDELYRTTGGNPFYVTEALAGEAEHVPETVRDAVLGRAARLSAGRATDARGGCDSCDRRRSRGCSKRSRATTSPAWRRRQPPGSSRLRDAAARCRSATRLPGWRSRRRPRPTAGARWPARDRAPRGAPAWALADPARLAHHAAALGDSELVLKFAPLAGQEASQLGAHREAAVHFGGALRFADKCPPRSVVSLFAATALELFLTVQFAEAADAQREAIRCAEELGDRRALAAALNFWAQLLWQVGTRAEGSPPRSGHSICWPTSRARSSSKRARRCHGCW